VERENEGVPVTPSLFVTATDTGVGKTFICCHLAELIRESGRKVGVLKPFSAGDLDDAIGLSRASGDEGPRNQVSLLFCRRPLTPAAQIGLGQPGQKIVEKTFFQSVATLKGLQQKKEMVLVEGLGGVLAPLGGPYFVVDLMSRLNLPVWVVARAGLGTLNHTLLTLEALKNRGLITRRILLNGFKGKDLSERTNGRLLKKITGIPVTEIPHTSTRVRERKARRLLWDALSTDFPSLHEKK
jgi:dethiobiotin synthetase